MHYVNEIPKRTVVINVITKHAAIDDVEYGERIN